MCWQVGLEEGPENQAESPLECAFSIDPPPLAQQEMPRKNRIGFLSKGDLPMRQGWLLCFPSSQEAFCLRKTSTNIKLGILGKLGHEIMPRG